MDSSSGPPPFNFFGERLAEIIKKAIKQQMSQSGSADQLAPKLQAMIEQQQQTNAQLGHLVNAVSQLNERVQENNRRNTRYPFWKKMALEVPPVVLAVLLAFGINSWWQGAKERQRADLIVVNLISEIKKNQQELERNIADNARRIPKLNALINALSVNPNDTSLVRGTGLDNYELTEAAWQTAILSNSFSAIDENIIMDAAKIYNLQLKRDDRTNEYLGSTYSRALSFFGSLDNISLHRAFLENLLQSDRNILRLYQTFLEKHGDKASAGQPLPKGEDTE